MSQENVENLRAFCEIWEVRGVPDLSLLDPAVVFEDNVLPDHAGETYRGHDGVVRAARTWLEAYEQFTVELEQVAGSGDRLVSIHRFRGKGRQSGIEDGARYAYLWTFRNAKVIHFVSFRDPADALEAVGLSESAMSQTHVEIVRHTMEVANRRDLDAIDGLATADYEWHNAPGFPGGGVHRGREAVKAFLREWLEMWETYTVDEQRVIDAGEQVVQLCHVHASGKGSGVTLDTPIAYVHTLRDGKFARTTVFLHHQEALEAVGLAGRNLGTLP